MMDNIQFIIGLVFVVIAAFFTGMAFTAWTFGDIKRENERLNEQLHKLTDRDERGRFKGGK